MILLINICKEKLHFYEFVKPVEDILKKGNVKYFIKNYREVTKKDLERADKIIICGTSLKDNDFLENLESFSWLKDFDKPVLGICGGMHIIGLVFGGKLMKRKEIGLKEIDFEKTFLGVKGKREVYYIHEYYVKSQEFESFADGNAVNHKNKNVYGVVFHPEVRNRELIETFVTA